jgi:hypothetical protein
MGRRLRDALWTAAEMVDPDAQWERERRILKKGNRAAGRVLEWKDHGRVSAGTTGPNVDLRLRVEGPGIESYEVKGRYLVPDHCIELIEGAVLDIAFDPGHRDRIALDWEYAHTPVVVEHPDGVGRTDLAKNLAAKREVVEIVKRHGVEDVREHPQARAELFDVLRRHGYPVDSS